MMKTNYNSWQEQMALVKKTAEESLLSGFFDLFSVNALWALVFVIWLCLLFAVLS